MRQSSKRTASTASCSWLLQESDRRRDVVTEHRRRQRAAEHRCGVDIDPVGPQVGLATPNWRVAVHDEAAEIARVGEKRLAHPEHVVAALPAEWVVRIDAGVDEEAR